MVINGFWYTSLCHWDLWKTICTVRVNWVTEFILGSRERKWTLELMVPWCLLWFIVLEFGICSLILFKIVGVSNENDVEDIFTLSLSLFTLLLTMASLSKYYRDMFFISTTKPCCFNDSLFTLNLSLVLSLARSSSSCLQRLSLFAVFLFLAHFCFSSL